MYEGTVVNKVEKATYKLLKFVEEYEAKKQLSCFVILTSDGVKNVRTLATSPMFCFWEFNSIERFTFFYVGSTT